jgi:hypothetical protein
MTDTRKKRPRDPAQLAKLMIDIASGEVEDRKPEPTPDGKDPAAVSLGRKGGLKVGKARAAKMTPDQRAEDSPQGRQGALGQVATPFHARQTNMGMFLCTWHKDIATHNPFML